MGGMNEHGGERHVQVLMYRIEDADAILRRITPLRGTPPSSVWESWESNVITVKFHYVVRCAESAINSQERFQGVRRLEMPASGSLSRTKALFRLPPLWRALHPVASDPNLDSTTRESGVQTLIWAPSVAKESAP